MITTMYSVAISSLQMTKYCLIFRIHPSGGWDYNHCLLRGVSMRTVTALLQQHGCS